MTAGRSADGRPADACAAPYRPAPAPPARWRRRAGGHAATAWSPRRGPDQRDGQPTRRERRRHSRADHAAGGGVRSEPRPPRAAARAARSGGHAPDAGRVQQPRAPRSSRRIAAAAHGAAGSAGSGAAPGAAPAAARRPAPCAAARCAASPSPAGRSPAPARRAGRAARRSAPPRRPRRTAVTSIEAFLRGEPVQERRRAGAVATRPVWRSGGRAPGGRLLVRVLAAQPEPVGVRAGQGGGQQPSGGGRGRRSAGWRHAAAARRARGERLELPGPAALRADPALAHAPRRHPGWSGLLAGPDQPVRVGPAQEPDRRSGARAASGRGSRGGRVDVVVRRSDAAGSSVAAPPDRRRASRRARC